MSTSSNDCSLPKTMRTWTYATAGAPTKVLSLTSTHPTSTTSAPTGSNLLIRISHAGLSSAGANLMGSVPSLLRKRHGGAIPELGYSGRVFLAGPSAPSDLREPGTAVFGTVHLSAAVAGGVDTLAEYILVPADSVVRKPENLSFAEAAGGLGCLAQTGLNMVIRGGVKSGDRVLVNGASGGVGSVALMAAKAAGAKEVVATCSEGSMEIVHQKFGADEVIDYRAKSPLTTYLTSNYGLDHRPFDVILDAFGSQSLFENSPKYLKPKGTYVNVGTLEGGQALALWRWLKNSTWPSFLGGVPRRFVMFGAQISGESSRKLGKTAEEGKLRVVVDSVYKMEDALEAYAKMKDGKKIGSVVV